MQHLVCPRTFAYHRNWAIVVTSCRIIESNKVAEGEPYIWHAIAAFIFLVRCLLPFVHFLFGNQSAFSQTQRYSPITAKNHNDVLFKGFDVWNTDELQYPFEKKIHHATTRFRWPLTFVWHVLVSVEVGYLYYPLVGRRARAALLKGDNQNQLDGKILLWWYCEGIYSGFLVSLRLFIYTFSYSRDVSPAHGAWKMNRRRIPDENNGPKQKPAHYFLRFEFPRFRNSVCSTTFNASFSSSGIRKFLMFSQSPVLSFFLSIFFLLSFVRKSHRCLPFRNNDTMSVRRWKWSFGRRKRERQNDRRKKEKEKEEGSETGGTNALRIENVVTPSFHLWSAFPGSQVCIFFFRLYHIYNEERKRKREEEP